MQEVSASSPTALPSHTRASSSSLVTNAGARSSKASSAAALSVSFATMSLR